MKLARVRTSAGESRAAIVDGSNVRLLRTNIRLVDVLHNVNPPLFAAREVSEIAPLTSIALLAPVDDQEIWAAGVTYQRSQAARVEESEGAAKFYRAVYEAERPELFFKATPRRVAGPHAQIRIRADSQWSVPEPELALVVSNRLTIVGFTIGNDVSARDIEGANPLYLPQAKIYDACVAIGPWIVLAETPKDFCATEISLTISRADKVVFFDTTSTARLKRTFSELVNWLGRDSSFPDGAFLLTGTGIVPPVEFTLAPGDVVAISIAGIGTLENVVARLS